MFEHEFLVFLPLINDHSFRQHTPLPPDNDRVCDHYAVLAFPQEKISHYTTAYLPFPVRWFDPLYMGTTD